MNFLLILATLTNLTDEGIRIHLFEAAEVTSRNVLLGDVARVEGQGLAAEQLRKLDLGRAPVPGHTRTLTVAGIRVAAEVSGRPMSARQFSGATEVLVRTETRAMDPELLRQEAERFLRANLGSVGDRMLFELTKDPGTIALYPKLGSPEITADWFGAPRDRGTVQLKLVVSQDGEAVGETTAAYRVRRFGAVLRLLQPVAKGQAVRPSQVVRVERELTDLRGQPVTRLSDVTELEASRGLPAGKILTHDLFQEPMLVRQGDQVRLIYRQGSLRILATGVARRSGRRGERIPVINPATDHLLMANLVGRGLQGEAIAQVQ